MIKPIAMMIAAAVGFAPTAASAAETAVMEDREERRRR